jgi:proton-translocating NADH-quinone oxidoreductase chain L
MKALIVNRIADMALIIGIILIYLTFLTLDFNVVFPLVPFFLDEKIVILQYELNLINLIGLLLFIGAMGKSAQIGLHTWLPDAMEGPTPVSALIHAATMVTAGVYLVIKCSPIYEYIPHVLNMIIFVGAFTAFFSALIGLVQNDIKKIIAYSTCSQLGYMVFCCGLSAYDISFFHLINHAFFKALLFLSAGSLIHSLANEQDLRRYGVTIASSRFIYIMFLIGSLALVGFPFLTGFYSKDLILEVAYATYTINSTFAYFIGLLTAFLTAVYSFRIIYLSFFFEKNIYRRFLTFETSIFFIIPLLFLAIGSVVFGYIAKDLFVGLGSDAFVSRILILPEHNYILEAEFFGWTKNSSL